MRLVLVLLAAAALAGAAVAKAPPSGIQLCGTNGCAPIAQDAAEQLFQASAPAPGRHAPEPYFLLTWTWDEGNAQADAHGYWLPGDGAVDLGGGWAPAGRLAPTLQQAATGLNPLPVPAPTLVTVGKRVAADPGSYVRLLSAGWHVKRWAGAVDWIPVRLHAPAPSPWTDGAVDLRISKASAFVWRDGEVFRISLRLARLARAGASLAG